jgi:nitrate/nitrite transporter NarK
MSTVGLGLAALVQSPALTIVLFCVAQIGNSAASPMFWPLPASFLSGTSAAAGIAAINSLGSLSGFAAPYAIGYLKDLTGNFSVGLLLLSACSLLGAIIALMLRIDVRRENISTQAVMARQSA